jgi:hypothetical protein
MFLPIIGISIASILLIKLGALAVWIGVLALALKCSVALIVLLAGLLGWQIIKK